jgi:capsular exopolysaccharide synthesis family protein
LLLPPADGASLLHDIWRTLKKRRRLIAIAFSAIAVLVAIPVLSAPVIYTADATLMIEPEAPQILEIPQVLGQALGADSYYETQYEILRSRALAERVVKAQPPAPEQENRPSALRRLANWLDPEVPPTPDEEFAGRVSAYQASLVVTPSRETRLVSVAFSGEDPALTARLANAHAEAYIEHGRIMRRTAAREALDFLVEQATELRKRVDAAEAKLAAYREEHGIVALDDPLDDRPNAVMERLTELNRALTLAETARMAREADYMLLRNGGHSLPTALQSPMLASLKQELARVESVYAALQTRYRPGYPDLVDAKAAVDKAREQLDLEIRNVTHGIESSYLAARDHETALREQVALQSQQALKLKDASVEYGMLENELLASKAVFDAVQQRIQQTDISAELRDSNVFLLQQAVTPMQPSGPGKALLLAVGLVLALVGSVGLALIAEQLDGRIRNSDELHRHLGLPALGSVPNLAPRGGPPGLRQARRLAIRARVREFGRDPAVDTPLVPHGAPPRAIEAYRRIRTNILLSQAEQAPRTLLFTSAGPGEGKTTTTLNTARLFAQIGSPVLVIDADLRKPDCHVMLELENTLGLTEILTGGALGAESVHRLDLNLALLAAGKRPPNPTELLGSDLMKQLLASACERFDYVLIDAPPLVGVSDSMLLATMVDGVVLVTDQQRTQRAQVKAAHTRLVYARAKVLGTVLNRAEEEEAPYYAEFEPAIS